MVQSQHWRELGDESLSAEFSTIGTVWVSKLGVELIDTFLIFQEKTTLSMELCIP